MNQPVYDRDESVSDPPRRRGRLLRAVIGLLVLAVIVAVVLVLMVKATSSESAKNDVTVTSCRSADGGKPTAAGKIVNHSSKTSNYVIRLKFRDADGNTLSEGVAAVDSVGADETATWELTGVRDAKGSVRCEITGVSRTHVPGQ